MKPPLSAQLATAAALVGVVWLWWRYERRRVRPADDDRIYRMEDFLYP